MDFWPFLVESTGRRILRDIAGDKKGLGVYWTRHVCLGTPIHHAAGWLDFEEKPLSMFETRVAMGSSNLIFTKPLTDKT